ncbi:efflux RND transporter periplasmic adaptor subunit [Desulforamulus aquiferis]|uniref:Efflux RND transporter periplasmic adaptor subunit n=1 Tax=Desulforamulus aquiferis TaxID=1397668 RepID=A0AAW7ZJT2_9FIRM|nr:efflux RND transporter periplasmic adaptor subunit [Desulforamulus aquiferis]MDO7789160.1 efflux RND transporter periplasmic adaptor subunit [Desulforamulus aquiferis]RYD06150.1 hypothetical protein N752_04485 [Desulforamulus aquiferis]
MKRSILLLVCVMLFAITASGCSKEEIVQEERLVPVEIIKATLADLEHSLNTSGEVAAGSDVAVYSKISGRVSSIPVKVGSQVAKGQVLFEMEATEARNALMQSEASLTLNEANLLRSERALEDARLSFERNKELYDAQAISLQQFEQAETALINAEANLKTAEAQLKQSEASLNTAQENYNNAAVTSPVSGIIATMSINVGDMVNPQVSVVTVVHLETTKVKVNLSENIIANIKVGDKVPVTINALNKNVTGTILTVAPKADAASKAFPVEVAIENTDGEIKPGMVARLNLSTGTSKEVVAVPTDALIERDGQYTAFLVEDERAKEVQVKIGVTSGELTEVKEGISEGDIVIIKGNRLVGEGQKVKIVSELGGASK